MNTDTRVKTKRLQLDILTPGSRLDKYLAQILPQFSRSYIKKLIDQSYILLNGQPTKASQKLNETDKITVILPAPLTYPSPESIPINVIYEDEDILVLDKPFGLTTHPAPGHPNHTLVNAILAYCPSITTSAELTRAGIVHRLDKDTSGLIIIAKNDFSRKYLADQFKDRTVKREYLVLVQGRLSPRQGIIEAPIGRDPHHRKRMTIVEAGKEASTKYKVREYLGNYTLIEVVPLTGRTHQIRVHMSAIGYPVAGDAVYGVKVPFLNRQFVHAYCLGFRLPSNNQYREFTSSLPEDLKQALQYLAAISRDSFTLG
jgi:23S rRNA pseudouridine1911/1915/1917 synthase